MNPLVSVVIAVYNGEKYLAEAIESVLAQTYSPIEIVVVNDGSDDDSEQIAKKYPVHYFNQPNQGQPSAANKGIEMAKGSYLAFLDADDLYMPGKTASQIEFLKENPHVDMVFGCLEQFFSPELSDEIRKKLVCPSGVSPGYLAPTGLFRRECFDRVGPFNEGKRIGSFMEWYMRSDDKQLKHAMLPDKVLSRRIHDSNMGINFKQSRLEYVQIVKEALKRRQLVER